MSETNTSDIQCFVAGAAVEHLPQIEYSISEISARLGIRIEVSCDRSKGPFHLVYGEEVTDARTVCLPYNPRCYDGTGLFKALGDPLLWAHESVDKPEATDIIGGVFRLLAFSDELQVCPKDRDRRGIFSTTSLPKQRFAVRAEPIVENHTKVILRSLHQLNPNQSTIDKWPGGKKWALLLTHDTDAVSISAKPELAFNFVKGITRHPLRFKMVLDGFRHMLKPLEKNPLYGFSKWKEAENAKDIQSAFYLYFRHGLSLDLSDWRSSVGDADFKWEELRSMAKDGWEFGLHPPIHAKTSINEFIKGKEFLEDKLEQPIFGLRHHYWALDWRKPHLTYRKHVNSGFRYDLSIAWRDSVGFRAGTCLPFRPWDPAREKGLDIYSIPTAIMDGHIIPMRDGDDFDIEECSKAAEDVIRSVSENGGVLTLDWHTESACNSYFYKGHIQVLDKILHKILAHDDVWLTTPWELTKHWHQRRNELS